MDEPRDPLTDLYGLQERIRSREGPGTVVPYGWADQLRGAITAWEMERRAGLSPIAPNEAYRRGVNNAWAILNHYDIADPLKYIAWAKAILEHASGAATGTPLPMPPLPGGVEADAPPPPKVEMVALSPIARTALTEMRAEISARATEHERTRGTPYAYVNYGDFDEWLATLDSVLGAESTKETK